MSTFSKNSSDELCLLKSFQNFTRGKSETNGVSTKPLFIKSHIIPTKREVVIVHAKKVEVLYNGYNYDVTDFIKRHPGGNIIQLYTDSGEDATIPIQQFHYRSLKTVMNKMKGLRKRQASLDEIVLDPETKKRHDELTKDFIALAADLESEGFMSPDPWRFGKRLFQSIAILLCGLLMKHWLGHWIIFRVLSVLLMTLAAGQCLWLGHETGHNSFTGNPKTDRILQIFIYGFAFGLSASSWNSTHAEHHAMPQHETKDSDLKTMPLIAFNKRVVRDTKHKKNLLLQYQHLLFVLCDTLIVTLTWKFNHHLKFVLRNKCWLDLICMTCHYSLVLLVGFVDWMLITWLGSIYVLGNLILNHTHLPVVEEGVKLHWVEYAFYHTTNVKSSWWVDWFTGHLNYQIEHHLFPAMPEYKGKLCRDKVKAFARRHNLPYQLCSYWEAVKSAYHNLEIVANEIKSL